MRYSQASGKGNIGMNRRIRSTEEKTAIFLETLKEMTR